MNVLHKRKRVEDHTDDDELEIPYKLGITNDVRPQNVKKSAIAMKIALMRMNKKFHTN